MAPFYTGLEAALELLLELVRRHVGPRRLQLLLKHDAGLGRLVLDEEPRIVCPGPLRDLVELVLARRRAHEQRPALPVRQGRPDHLAEHGRRLHPELVEHDPVQVDAPHGVRVARTVDPDLRPGRIVDAQLGLVDLHAGNRAHVVLHVIPCGRLALSVGRRDVGKARAFSLAHHRALLQQVDGEHRLAEAPVTDEHSEPVRTHSVAHHALKWPRPVRDLDVVDRVALPHAGSSWMIRIAPLSVLLTSDRSRYVSGRRAFNRKIRSVSEYSRISPQVFP